MERLFLIDSMSHIFRAYYAPMGARQEPLRNSKGQVTQAVFVFTNMLRKLLNDEKPDYIAAVFDTAAPTFRHDSFAAYKANREEMPDELASQIPLIERVCEAFNIPIIKYDGYEADDIIGTLAKQAAENKIQAVIVSNDKDLCQLVKDPYVIVMRQNSANIKRKVPVPPIEWCDEAWVEKKFGVPPSKIVDLLGLMGDAIDNIPGAPGIGEKGALKLVLEFGSAKAAIENADKITHKTYRESLKNNKDLVLQSLELATVNCDVPIKLDLETLRRREPDRSKAFELFRELEFNSLTKEFEDAAPLFSAAAGRNGQPEKLDYRLVRTRQELDAMIRQCWEATVAAIEVDDSNKSERHSAFDKLPPLGIAFAIKPATAYFVDLERFVGGRDSAIRPLADYFSSRYLEKSAHDFKRNYAVLKKLGFEVAGFFDDPMIASYLLDSGRPHHELEFLARNHLPPLPKTVPAADFPATGWKAAERADLVLRLAPMFRDRIIADGLLKVYSEIEIPLEPILAEIEIAGMKVDAEALKQFSEFIFDQLQKIAQRIFQLAGREFNINSPKQVGEIFAEMNIATGRKTATGQISTSKDVLSELAENYEIAQLIIDYREMDKLKATYADALPKMIRTDGRIHGVLNQTVAATGRLSSTEPNLQNIPIRTELGQRIRKAFIPEKGNKLISADYSQLELRILAHITKDPVMTEAFLRGEDIHAKTARLVFGAKDEKELKEKRRLAKIVNFGIAYAVEAFGLSQRVGISKEEARKVIDDYFKTYKGIREYMDRIPKQAREKGYVTSLFGRRRYFPGINDRNFAVRSRAEREAINMPIQGTASDIVKIAMIKVFNMLREHRLETKMIMQVHDELLFEGPESEVDKAMRLIKAEMESAVSLDVPLVVEIGSGDNWVDIK
ncbi:MAG: DNA polymerase I [Blastocatellia bacterium]